jgi:hypothetical protein
MSSLPPFLPPSLPPSHSEGSDALSQWRVFALFAHPTIAQTLLLSTSLGGKEGGREGGRKGGRGRFEGRMSM